MPNYKINKVNLLIAISVILPFFDWSENLINVGNLFYFNIYKLCFLAFLIHYIKFSLDVNKYNFYKIALVIALSGIFIIWHNSFTNLKGFFFVLSFFVLYLSNKSSMPNKTGGIVKLLKFLIVFVFIFSIIEVILDVKFITPDFSDNHRDLLGVNIRRASFTFQDPNYLAYHVGLIFLLLKYLCQEKLNRYLIITVIIILFTGSRGALLAFFLAQSHKYWINLMKIKYLVFTTIILLLPTFFYVNDFKINGLEEIYMNSSPDTRTIVTRVVLYISALVTLYHYPIFGIGHGQVSIYGKSEMLPITLPNDVLEIIDEMGFHNYFLEFAVENGLPFLLFFLYIFRRSYEKKPHISIFMFCFLCTSGYESPLTFLLLIL